MATISMQFSALDPSLHTAAGRKVGTEIRLGPDSGFGLFGPYVDLPAGPCVARILFDGPAVGHAMVDILAEGCLVLTSRSVDLSALDGQPVEVSANLARAYSRCEVRLNCAPGVRATIVGVVIEVSQFLDARQQIGERAGREENLRVLIHLIAAAASAQ